MSKSNIHRSSPASSRQPRAFLANLLATAEHLASYPCLTVQQAADRLGVEVTGWPVDLLDLVGADACEAIEAEAIVHAEGWAA